MKNNNYRLIVEFMGGTIDSLDNVMFIIPADGRGLAGCSLNACRYDSDWNWLMPVVEKIKKMKHDPKECFMGTTLERELKFENVLSLPFFASIESVFRQIVQFIKWYNLMKENKLTTPAKHDI